MKLIDKFYFQNYQSNNLFKPNTILFQYDKSKYYIIYDLKYGENILKPLNTYDFKPTPKKPIYHINKYFY